MKAVGNPWAYLGVVFVLSFAWQVLLYFNGGVSSGLFPVLMLFPASVAVVYRLRTGEGFRNVGWGLRKWWYLVPVMVVPVIVVLAVTGLCLGLGWGNWAGKVFRFEGGMVEVGALPLWPGSHTQSVAAFAISFLVALLIQSVPGSLVTLGEEFGWRGYVQEKLLRRFGINAGLSVLGITWGLWHLPIVLMGWNFPNHPVLGALVLMPLSTAFMGAFLGWLSLRSRSIWMPSLAHAAINRTATTLFVEMETGGDEMPLQLTWIAAWGVVAAVCLVSLNRTKPTLWQAAGAVPELRRE
jgi:membrane protease YdiL (CAAX protease family)